MRIVTGFLSLMVGALIWLPIASSHAAPSAPDSLQIVQPEGAASNSALVVIGQSGRIGSPDPLDIPLHSFFSPAMTTIARESAQAGIGQLGSLLSPSSVSVIFKRYFGGEKVPRDWRIAAGEWFIAKNEDGKNDYLASLGLPDAASTIAYKETFSDVKFSAKIMRKSSVGSKSSRLIVRASGGVTSDGHFLNEYTFNFTRRGTYSVFKRVDGRIYTLASWAKSDAIQKGNRWNKVIATAKGDLLSFHINGQLVWEGEDDSLEEGVVGIGFYNDPDSTDNELFVDWAILRVFSDETSRQAHFSPDNTPGVSETPIPAATSGESS